MAQRSGRAVVAVCASQRLHAAAPGSSPAWRERAAVTQRHPAKHPTQSDNPLAEERSSEDLPFSNSRHAHMVFLAAQGKLTPQ